jgi:hypothetical protein
MVSDVPEFTVVLVVERCLLPIFFVLGIFSGLSSFRCG